MKLNELKTPSIILNLDDKNKIKKISSYEKHGTLV